MKNENIKFGEYDYEIIKMNLLHIQVCSNCPPVDIDELQAAVRLYSPAGTSNNWYVEKEGDLAPVECSNGNRWHYMFTC